MSAKPYPKEPIEMRAETRSAVIEQIFHKEDNPDSPNGGDNKHIKRALFKGLLCHLMIKTLREHNILPAELFDDKELVDAFWEMIE